MHHGHAPEVPPRALCVLLLPEAAQQRHLQRGLGEALLQGVLHQALRVETNTEGLFHEMGTLSKLVNGSWVGQVGPVDSCGQVRDLDPSLVKSRNLSRVGQVRPVDS